MPGFWFSHLGGLKVFACCNFFLGCCQQRLKTGKNQALNLKLRARKLPNQAKNQDASQAKHENSRHRRTPYRKPAQEYPPQHPTNLSRLCTEKWASKEHHSMALSRRSVRIEHQPHKLEVEGSNPSPPAMDEPRPLGIYWVATGCCIVLFDLVA